MSSTSRFSRVGSAYATCAVILVNTLILMMVLELGASVILQAFPRETQNDAFVKRMLRLNYYYTQDWAPVYWQEHMASTQAWHYSPYVLWHTDAYDGEYIHVDEQGKRATVGQQCGADAYRIFLFGGSTMWGFGGRDQDTIASFLQAQLPTVCVENFGELGYNSTQELLALIYELQRGNVPDMVIFYDGVNDVSTANRYSDPGGHFYAENIVPYVGSQPRTNVLAQWIESTHLYRLIKGEPPVPAPPNLAYPPFDAQFLEDVTSVYLTNLKTASVLGETYGFEFFAFLQPNLAMVERPLNAEEQDFMFNVPGGWADLMRTVYGEWQQLANESDDDYFVDLTHSLDTATEPIWIDSHHVTPWGNLIVSDRIFKTIESVLPR